MRTKRKQTPSTEYIYTTNEGIFNHVLMNAATLSTQITPSVSVHLPLHLLLCSPPLIISIVYIVCRYFPEVRASKNIHPSTAAHPQSHMVNEQGQMMYHIPPHMKVEH